MARYIWHNGEWVEAVAAPRPAAVPSIIRDHMEALLHPATGQRFDSKSEFRRATKEAGCVEYGNDLPAMMAQPRKPVRDEGGVEKALVGAWKKLNEGYKPPPLPEAPEGLRIYE